MNNKEMLNFICKEVLAIKWIIKIIKSHIKELETAKNRSYKK